MLEGSSLRALVVGGGSVAARKTRALLAAGASVRVVAPSIDPSLVENEGEHLLLIRRAYESADIGDALLVTAATSSREVNARVARDATALGRLVNVADMPDEGNCTTAATHRAGDVVIAVSTGRVPGAAARIRDCIAQRFAEPYAAAVAELASLRTQFLASGDRDGWRRLVDTVVDQHFCETVERGELASRMAAWR
jgi:siroheme synthase-like protein